VNPFKWYGVVETQNFFVLAQIVSSTPEVDPAGNMGDPLQPEETPVTLAAKKTRPWAVLPGLGEFPTTEPSRPRRGYCPFRDLAFDQPLRKWAQAASGGVELGSQSEWWGSSSAAVRSPSHRTSPRGAGRILNLTPSL